jgi:hypothetical protein
MDSVAFALPSLWPKLIGVLKILLIEVVASRLGGNRCTLTDGDVFDVVIFIRHSEEYAVDWSIVSGRLVLDPIDIGQFFILPSCTAFNMFLPTTRHFFCLLMNFEQYNMSSEDVCSTSSLQGLRIF